MLYSMSRWVIPQKGRKYAEHFQRAEYVYTLPHHLLARMALQESAYNPNARSPAGAIGLMQIVPEWHPGVDPTDPVASIDYAGQFMRKLYNRFRDWRKALAAYNAGPTRLQSEIKAHGANWLANMPAETQNYVARISADVLA